MYKTKPKIILASKSKARQKLLRQIGLKFTVCVCNIKESHKLRQDCGKLVINNALLKAKSAAQKFDTGIIVAADTVVLAGKKIIGKPRNLRDAFATLKTISRKPQWVYTGLAVMDIEKNKIFTDCEKTKIYMYCLSAKQIKNYFKKVSPLDKAGSFDIQGLGAALIDRIEGCFYNVVGLPLAKLAKLLKKVGVEIF
jgi:septum formation protein